MKRHFLALLSLCILSISLVAYEVQTIITPYGNCVITEQVIIELLKHPYVQRLKSIRQYGVSYYTINKTSYNRFDHSVGVMFLLRKFGASVAEQLAGLLHDVSHTVFSHVGDYVFDHPDHAKGAYQDAIHGQFLSITGLEAAANKHGYLLADIMHKNKKYRALEQDLPDICADRLEYNLYGGLLENLLTETDVQDILADIKFEDNRWFFTDAKLAEKLARVSLYHTEHIWGSAEQLVLYRFAGKAIKRAVDLQELTLADIHYSIDDRVWDKLVHSSDKTVRKYLKKMHAVKKYMILDEKKYDIIERAKFRGLNPWVVTDNGVVRLTDLSMQFAQDFTRLKDKMAQGYKIRLKTRVN